MKKMYISVAVATGLMASGMTTALADTATPSAYQNVLESKLDATKAPAENFDLTKWKINLPIPDDKPEREGKVMEIYVQDFSSHVPPYTHPEWFYTDANTGAMVFKTPNHAVTTPNSKNARTELRAMLATDYSDPKTNFAIAANDKAEQYGAVGGHLSATLSVDWVSTSGNDAKTGAHAVVIGQIHGSKNEPLKIIYRKLPGHEYGSLSWNYETNPAKKGDRRDIKHDVFGKNKLKASDQDPQDGIRLGELFSYDVNVKDNIMHLTFTKNMGEEDEVAKTFDVDLSKAYPGAEKDTSYAQDWMYFKAGSYNQCNQGSSQCTNNGIDAGDYTQVSFYQLNLDQ